MNEPSDTCPDFRADGPSQVSVRWQIGGDVPDWLHPFAKGGLGTAARLFEARRMDEVLPLVRRVWQASLDGAWCCGFVGYEAACAFDPAFVTAADHSASGSPDELPLACFLIADRLEDLSGAEPQPFTFVRPWLMDNRVASDCAAAPIDAVRAAIADGRYYQLNLTAGLSAMGAGSAHGLFDRLAQLQPAMLGFCMETPRWALVSASPELFFQWDGDLIQTRPMKGTAPPSGDEQQDRDRLRSSDKDRAENVMIVDLLRNDLSRIARPGTVAVPSLFDVHTHPTVVQMTSTVQARTRDGATLEDVLKALFPCGSVTGAPKHEAMRHLAELEGQPRGVYCGAVGLVAPGGKAFFNVAIRTLVHCKASGQLHYGVGSGLTWYSDPAAEWEEWQWKTRIAHRAARAFSILETVRLQDGVWVRQSLHMARMARSALAFGYVFDPSRILTTLQARAAEHPEGAWRGRWLLDADGGLSVELYPLDVLPLPVCLQLAEQPMDAHPAELPFVRHKTTWRAPYERHASPLPAKPDVLLKAADGALLETARGNLVVADAQGLWTPDSVWQLPGILQQELLANGRIKHRRLGVQALEHAKAVWVINSLRGWMPVDRIVDSQGGLLMRFEPDFRVSSVP